MTIKSFIYLDEYKMYSISSQIFEGLTEYIISHQSNSKSESEQQKGPVGSGRILGDIISHENASHEKRFLHDYSYTLFEKKLLEDNRVYEVRQPISKEMLLDIQNHNFIKVSGSMIFNDIIAINNTLTKFDDIGRAFTYVTNQAKLKELKDEAKSNLKIETNKSKKAKIENNLRDNVEAKLQELSNFEHDQEYHEHIAYLLDYGFQDQLEARINLQNLGSDTQTVFSANIDRNFLKESEQLLIRKYARYTETKFTIFGMITQSGSSKENTSTSIQSDTQSIKKALMDVVASFSTLEQSFTGRLENEIIIDPIAIYREL